MDIKNIKNKLGILFIPIFILLCFLVYKFAKKIYQKIRQKQLNNQNTDGRVLSTDGTPINLEVQVSIVYDECFNTVLSEDEDKIINAIKIVRLSDMPKFAQIYNRKVTEDNNWYLFGYHSPSTLSEDMTYFLESRVSEIQAHLNSI